MEYVKDPAFGAHLVFLSPEETDRFFAPFDPTDNDMPSYLHRLGHRYILDEPYQWLLANVGEPKVDWESFRSDGTCRAFSFDDPNKAMLFKLTYQGV